MGYFFVINHFRPRDGSSYIAASTLLSAALASNARQVNTVLVVDGSEQPDPDLERSLARVGARYLHAGRRLSFAEGYNLGLAQSDERWTILCASDVYPSLTIFDTLDTYLGDNNQHSIGCVIPMLSSSDLPIQQSRTKRLRPTEVPLMTLNFNMFETDYLRSIGGIPERFSGNYNDVALCATLQRDGRPIIMVPDRCIHYGSMTLASGGSNVSWERDKKEFSIAFPELFRAGGLWQLDLRRFTTNPILRAVVSAAHILPARAGQKLVCEAMDWLLLRRA